MALKVEVEVTSVGIPEDVSRQQTFVALRGVYQRVTPTPRPVEAHPASRKRGHTSLGDIDLQLAEAQKIARGLVEKMPPHLPLVLETIERNKRCGKK